MLLHRSHKHARPARSGGRVTLLIMTLLIFGLTAQAAFAGSPHFVGTPNCSPTTGPTTTCSGKVAGLGNETQIRVIVTAEAECVNRGGHNPNAGNKETVSGGGNFPVQNGKSNFSLTLSATFDPPCSPPMVVQWSLIRVDVYQGCSEADTDPSPTCTGGTLILSFVA